MSGLKERISAFQLAILIATFMGGSTLLIAFMDTITGHDTWLSIAVAYVISVPFVLSFGYLIRRFPGKNFIEINEMIYGKYLGGFISLLYIAFFFLLLTLNLRDVAGLYRAFLLSDTPVILLVALLTLACGYGVYLGIEVIARSSLLVCLYTVLSIALSSLLLLPDMKAENFLPLFDISLQDFIQGTTIIAVIPFLDIAIFLMVIPFLNHVKQAPKSIFLGFTLGAMLILVVALRNTAVLGASAQFLTQGSFQAVRLINLANFLSRIELFIAIGITLAGLIKMSVLYYITVAGIGQLLRLRNMVPLILPVGGMAVIVSLINFKSNIYHAYAGRVYDGIWAIPAEVIIPVVSILIAKIRKLPQEGGHDQ